MKFQIICLACVAGFSMTDVAAEQSGGGNWNQYRQQQQVYQIQEYYTKARITALELDYKLKEQTSQNQLLARENSVLKNENKNLLEEIEKWQQCAINPQTCNEEIARLTANVTRNAKPGSSVEGKTMAETATDTTLESGTSTTRPVVSKEE